MKYLLIDWLRVWYRMFRTSKGALPVIALLALGMGGAAAIFNPVYSLIAAPLPFPQPDRLVRIGGNIPIFNLTYSNFEKRELLDRIFTNLAAFALLPDHTIKIRVSDTGKELETSPLLVTEEFFETLGVRPIIGYDFRQQESTAGAVIISHRFWQKEFMGADDVVGKSILFTTRPVTIVGVMPETFDFPVGTDIWECVCGRSWQQWSVFPNSTQLLGRLRSGISSEQAVSDLTAFDLKPDNMLFTGNDGPVFQSLQTLFYGDRLPLLWMIGTAAVLFLLLVCANVANLLVARSLRRKSEMALRLILGATRWGLVRHLLWETLPLVIIGGVAGLILAEFAGIWLQAQFPTFKGGAVVIPVKMAFFAALVIAVTIISGLTPALQSARVDLNTQLKSADGGSKRRFFSSQEILVGVQLGLTLTLLIGAGVLLRSLMYHIDFPIGWSPQQIVVVSAEFPSGQSSSSPEGKTRQTRFHQDALRQLEAMPDVVSVGSLSPIPFTPDALRTQSSMMSSIYKDVPAKNSQELINQASVPYVRGRSGSGGFDVLGIPLLAGRLFNSADIAQNFEVELEEAEFQSRITSRLRSGDLTPPEFEIRVTSPRRNPVIVNRNLAQHFWPGENAVGKTLYERLDNFYPLEIVGIVPDFHLTDHSKTFAPMIYYVETGTGVSQKFLVMLRSKASLASF